jgi:hypothetical protein
VCVGHVWGLVASPDHRGGAGHTRPHHRGWPHYSGGLAGAAAVTRQQDEACREVAGKLQESCRNELLIACKQAECR